MFQTIRKLYLINLLTPKGLFFFIGSILSEGVNLMALLRFSAKLYPDRIAIHEKEGTSTYSKLFGDSKNLAVLLRFRYNLHEFSKVALICRNHLVIIQSIFALSRLGVNVYLLNIEMSTSQFKKIIGEKEFDLIIYDEEKSADFKEIDSQKCILSYHNVFPSINNIVKSEEFIESKLSKYKAGKIVILTSGTTGEYKTAGRKPSVTNFVNPIIAFLTKIHMDKYRSVYIATPIYHGSGLGALIVFTLLGIEQYILNRYVTEDSCSLIRANKIESVILVPLMIQRMLKNDKSALGSLKCILSGSATLNADLAQHTLLQLGDVLYNLYGTSEAGFSILATPDDLKKYPTTIGKPINGVSIKIVDENKQELKFGNVGMLCLKSSWVVDSEKNLWVPTGDLGYVGKDGYVFLCGRSDNMIVSGGENVYPEILELALTKNELIESASVIGIPDVEFGQRLKAFVVLKEDSNLTEDLILEWLSDKVARYQIPAQIRILDSLPISSTGKIDKNKLSCLD